MLVRVLLAAAVLGGCSGAGDSSSTPTGAGLPAPAKASEAPVVAGNEVSGLSILVAYQGALRAPRGVTRTREEAQALANQLVERAEGGESFAELARKYSDDTSSARGGDVGTFARDGVRPPFDVLFTLRPGQIASVAETGYGFHIIERAP